MADGSRNCLCVSTATPQNKIEALETPPSLPPGKRVAVARCMSHGGRPPSRINWTFPAALNATTDNRIPTSGLELGTTNVTSYLALVPSSQADGQNVTCVVQHDSFREPVLLTKTLTVHCEWNPGQATCRPPCALCWLSWLGRLHTSSPVVYTGSLAHKQH